MVTFIGNQNQTQIFTSKLIFVKKEIKLSQVLQRELKGKVLSRVAKEIGVGVSILHDWYSSSRKPSAKNMWQLKKLADYLGLSLEQILFDEKVERQIISSTTFTDRGVQYRVNIEKLKG
ncbi:MAG: helix-turn-helix transcriptional regulator [Bdellovibrionaceae bacterium]|nr:helix-turn-helix transcriptional regulator [Pseudobdellovibrionaceae bacterium]